MSVKKHARPLLGGFSRKPVLAVGTVVVLGAVAAIPNLAAAGTGHPGPAPAERPAGAAAAQKPEAVGRATYQLGNQAFTPAAPYQGKSEIAAVVHYPKDRGGVARGRHPLIVMQHGLWATCADRSAQRALERARKAFDQASKAGDKAGEARQQKIIDRMSDRLWAWPCKPGVDALPSSSGYDYLAENLARQGFVVVSMGANGINATSGGQADSVYQARADLINRHLDLWRRLETGQGPLAGKVWNSGHQNTVSFTGKVDLKRVGTLGHSMGGGGVMQHVSDQRHKDWPAGVQVKAALGLAPTATWDNEPITRVPLAVLWGTCDQVNTGEFIKWNSGRNKVPLHGITLTGGNHNSFNTQWSPRSGQVGGVDDALPGTRPGTCASQDGRHKDQTPLGENVQRRITTGYATAFFRRYLLQDTAQDPLLEGRKKLAGVPDVTKVDYKKPH
ncbi:alpha/beta hydrolase family protein [Streptomyces sp. NPDC048182]|uniref:alpha/beta hydrolase family protein n=1 Tax=Streptomyces sp. NPDC048182 TaxID=3365507 RepID=UPI00371EF81E